MDLFRPRIAAHQWRRQIFLPLVLCAFIPIASAQDSQHDFLLFPSLDSFDSFDESDPLIADSFVRPSLNVLYSYNGGKFRFLAEYLWSSTEAELERAKLGWQASDNTMLWFGRFHSTAKFWTSEYHHGQFMQTSITRPSLVRCR